MTTTTTTAAASGESTKQTNNDNATISSKIIANKITKNNIINETGETTTTDDEQYSSSLFADDASSSDTKISPPITVIFIYFIYNNFLVFASCYIIPGATREFAQFILTANDTPAFFVQNPDAGIGLLAASLLGAYSAATLVAAHYVHIFKWKNIMLVALILWSLSLLGSGLAYYANSYWMLFTFRVISGILESALAVIAPPMFQGRGGAHGGIWLALFLTAATVGAAFGFHANSIIANNPRLGWQWAYLFYFFITLPLIGGMACIKDETNDGKLSAPDGQEQESNNNEAQHVFEAAPTESDDVEKSQEYEAMISSSSALTAPAPAHQHTIWQELKICLSNDILIFITLSNTIFYSVVAALSTFTASFILALGIVEKEETAATMIGLVISFSGLIGSPIGGLIVDHIQHNLPSDASPAMNLIAILPRVGQLFMCGIFFGIISCFVYDAISFMVSFMLCWIFHFCAQSGMQWAIMLSVNRVSERPNAVAFAMFCSGLLGGMPFTIIYGAFKDMIAPQCNIDADGNFVDEEGCIHDGRGGVRKCMVLAWVYLLFTPLFLVIAKKFALVKVNSEGCMYGDITNSVQDNKNPLGSNQIREIS